MLWLGPKEALTTLLMTYLNLMSPLLSSSASNTLQMFLLNASDVCFWATQIMKEHSNLFNINYISRTLPQNSSSLAMFLRITRLPCIASLAPSSFFVWVLWRLRSIHFELPPSAGLSLFLAIPGLPWHVWKGATRKLNVGACENSDKSLAVPERLPQYLTRNCVWKRQQPSWWPKTKVGRPSFSLWLNTLQSPSCGGQDPKSRCCQWLQQ